MFKKPEIIIYDSMNGHPTIEVYMEEDTIWLTQKQIGILFNTQRAAITKHLNNIFKSGELDKNSVCSKMEHTAADNKTYNTQFYNLDAIISVGYRINSQKATQFRIWATQVLKNHLIKGYTINEKQLLQTQTNLKELQNTINFLQEKSKNTLLLGQEYNILDLLAYYSTTLTILEQYDRGSIPLITKGEEKFILTYDDTKRVIHEIKKELINKNEATELFGRKINNNFKAIIGNIYQTFNDEELYPSLEEKAAQLLYFIIKDHPFVDGNKRIASCLFIYFLDKNNYLLKPNNERNINDNTLTALTLLIAISDPKDKDILIKIITNLVNYDNITLNS